METAAECDHQRAARRDLGQLHGRLDRLGPGVREEEAVGRIGPGIREALRQPAVQLETRLVIDDVLLEVDAARGLLGDRGHNARMGVSGVHDADAARVVEVARAVDRLDPAA